MAAHKEPSAKSVGEYDVHVFAANLNGPQDWNKEPIECLHCPFPKGNAVHVTSEQLVEGLSPNPIADVDDRILGEAHEGVG